MSDRTIENATIASVNLGFHDGYGSTPSAWVHLTYAYGGGQGMGGYGLGGKATHVFVYGVLDALKCESWERLKGLPCRVDHEFTKVHRIGHYLEDRWFDPAEAMKAIQEAP